MFLEPLISYGFRAVDFPRLRRGSKNVVKCLILHVTTPNTAIFYTHPIPLNVRKCVQATATMTCRNSNRAKVIFLFPVGWRCCCCSQLKLESIDVTSMVESAFLKLVTVENPRFAVGIPTDIYYTFGFPVWEAMGLITRKSYDYLTMW